MKKLIAIILIIALFSSCFEKAENLKTDNPTVILNKDSIEAEKIYPLSGCYQMTIDNDTAYMNLTHKNDSITGALFYNKNGKVNDAGFVYLIKINNRAEGWYSYKLEGKFFVMQKVFKINKNKLAEGYGEIKMENDTARFKYSHALNFEEKHTFNKVNCK